MFDSCSRPTPALGSKTRLFIFPVPKILSVSATCPPTPPLFTNTYFVAYMDEQHLSPLPLYFAFAASDEGRHPVRARHPEEVRLSGRGLRGSQEQSRPGNQGALQHCCDHAACCTCAGSGETKRMERAGQKAKATGGEEREGNEEWEPSRKNYSDAACSEGATLRRAHSDIVTVFRCSSVRRFTGFFRVDSVPSCAAMLFGRRCRPWPWLSLPLCLFRRSLINEPCAGKYVTRGFERCSMFLVLLVFLPSLCSCVCSFSASSAL